LTLLVFPLIFEWGYEKFGGSPRKIAQQKEGYYEDFES